MRTLLLKTNRFRDYKFYISSVFSVLVLISLSATLSLAAETYQYDRYNRLYRIHNGSLNQQFDYDSSGNRVAITSNSNDYDFDGIPDTVENMTSLISRN